MAKEVTVITASQKQRFSEDEKRRLVAESYETELGLNNFSKKVGVSPAAISIWRKKYKVASTAHNTALVSIPHVMPQAIPNGFNHDIEAIQKLNEELLSENKALKEKVFRMEAFFGRKMYQLENRVQ